MLDSDFAKRIIARFKGEATDRMGRDTVLGIISISEYYELEDDIDEFLRENPDAGLYETDRFMESIKPQREVIIVDDDEIDDEDEDE